MELLAPKNDMIEQLQREIISMQRTRKTSGSQYSQIGLGPMESAFPEATFPTGAIHELISRTPEDAAASNGFIAGLLGSLMQGKACLWIGARRTIFPPALKIFGIDPDRVIFIDNVRPKEALWAIEEALKCDALAAVVGEIGELTFMQSRRLQLAVEQSHVTGFIHRQYPKTENTVACVTRWKIRPLASALEEGMPGVGMPRWDVRLLKVRNGKPGNWQFEWSDRGFRHITQEAPSIATVQTRKTG